jgi:uncharacterized SAM-binding protein YcdF (DUF218 family)
LFRRRWLALVAAAILCIFSTPAVSRFLTSPLERRYPPKPVASAPQADAIVVLSGGIVRGINAEGIQWGESANRYFTGFDLFEAGKARLLVFSAASTDEAGGPTHGEILRHVAVQHGVPPDRIVVVSPALVTTDEARGASKIPGVHSVLLVTSAYHMPRSVLLFRARGLEVHPFPTDERILGSRIQSLGYIPFAHPLDDSEKALREYYGLAVYRMILLFHPSSL